MALIKCPECGREKVSDSAESCPECGFGIKAYIEERALEKEKQEIPKLYDEDDADAYKLIVNGFYGTDTAACAGLEEFLEISFEYDEAMKLFGVGKFAIAMYDSEEEAIDELELLAKWGINAYIIDPSGCEKYSNVESYNDSVIMNSFSSKKVTYTSESLNVDGLMKVLCFLIPIVGIIIYCINVSSSPMQSRRCLKISVAGIIVGIISATFFLVGCSSKNEQKEEPWNETARYENNIKNIDRIWDIIEEIVELDENVSDDIDMLAVKKAQAQHELELSLEDVYNDCIDNKFVVEDEFQAYKNRATIKHYTDKEKAVIMDCIKSYVDETMREALLEFYE